MDLIMTVHPSVLVGLAGICLLIAEYLSSRTRDRRYIQRIAVHTHQLRH